MSTRARVSVAAGALAAAIGLCGAAGCAGSQPTAAAPRIKSGAQREVGNTITYDPLGSSTELDCGHGKSLNVTGSNNTLTVRGSCASVTVAGADNRLTFDRIERLLTITGLSNVVVYKAGDPTIDNQAASSTVKRG